MQKRKSLAIIVAALLTVAPISAPLANTNNTQVVQAAHRHVSHRTYYTHTRNWVTKHYYDKRTGRRNWMRMRNSPAWQREFRQSIAEDADDVATRAHDYNDSDIIQQIKQFNIKTGSTLFPSNHAVIYVSPYLYRYPNGVGYRAFRQGVMKAARMWEPAFHFTMTDNPQDANVTVAWSPERNNRDVADEVDCDVEPETHKKITVYYREYVSTGYDDYGLVYLIAHELGHAIGLPHDTNLDSVMADDDAEYEPISYEDFRHYQATWVTAADKRVVEKLYNEN